jgi:DNA-binding CsgD family transcriptional regulator
MGEPVVYKRYVPVSDKLPAPVLQLLRQITGAANGSSNTPPRVRVSTAFGVLTLEARWLVPAGTLAADAARDPQSCLIAVTIDLHEHAIAHASRVLRENGATPAQTKVGIHLVLGKTQPAIADELGIQLSSVADHTKRLYQTLDVHNSAELATKIWLGQRQVEARQNLRAPDKFLRRLPHAALVPSIVDLRTMTKIRSLRSHLKPTRRLRLVRVYRMMCRLPVTSRLAPDTGRVA